MLGLMVLGAPEAAAQQAPLSIHSLGLDDGGPPVFDAMGLDERMAAARRLTELLRRASAPSPGPTSYPGVSVRVVREGHHTFWVLGPDPDGAVTPDSILVVRVGPDAVAPGQGVEGTVERAIVMAPHPHDDRHTGALAVELFRSSRARALVVSRIGRRVSDGRGGTADAARREDSFFHAVGLTFDALWRDGVFLQVHGFESAKHPALNSGVAAIVSSARPVAWTQPALEGPHRFLTTHSRPGTVALYGHDTGELGGRSNVLGRALHRTGRNHFVHLEMSRPLRDAWFRSGGRSEPAASLRRAVLEMLAGHWHAQR